MRIFATVALAAVGVGTCFAQNPTGNWKGKLDIKMPPIPASATPQQKAQYEQGMAQIKKISFAMTIKADKTWSITANGLPAAAAGNSKQSGTWTQSGNKVTLKAKPNPKNPQAPNTPQVAEISADGKTMRINLPQGQGAFVFKR